MPEDGRTGNAFLDFTTAVNETIMSPITWVRGKVECINFFFFFVKTDVAIIKENCSFLTFFFLARLKVAT